MTFSSYHNRENKPILHQLSSLPMASPICGIHLYIREKIWHMKFLDETYLWDSLFNSDQNYKFKSSYNKSWSKTGIASECSIKINVSLMENSQAHSRINNKNFLSRISRMGGGVGPFKTCKYSTCWRCGNRWGEMPKRAFQDCYCGNLFISYR